MSERDKINRSSLPIPDVQHIGFVAYDAKDPDSKFPPIRQLLPPKGAPNVIVILIDDVGFGASQRLSADRAIRPISRSSRRAG